MTVALNILYIKEKEICLAYISKINSNCEKQIILLIIPNEEKEGLWHYLAVKKLSTLLRGITSKQNGDLYCLNCLHSFRTENKLKSHEKVCKNKDFGGIVMPPKNPEVSSITKIGEYIPCGYSMSTIWAFDRIKKKLISWKRLYEKVL